MSQNTWFENVVLTEIKHKGSIRRKNGEMCYCGQNAGVIKPQNALSCKDPLRVINSYRTSNSNKVLID